jgi:hypothetical protein
MVRDAMQESMEAGTGLSPMESIATGVKGFKRGVARGANEAYTGRFLNQENKFDLGNRINSLRDWSDLFKGQLKNNLRHNQDGEISLATKLETVSEMTFGFVPDITYRGLRLGDQTFRSAAKLKEIFRQARKAEGSKIANDQEAEAWYEQLKNDPERKDQYDKTRRVIQRAEDYAVFAHDTKSSFAAGELLRAARKVGDYFYGDKDGNKIAYSDDIPRALAQTTRRALGNAMNLITGGTVPFVKVPTNILSMAKDVVIPIQPIFKIYEAIDSGNLDGVDEHIGTLMSSGMTWGLFLAAKQAGSINMLTKDEERDPAKRAIAYEKGAPNSINVHRTMRYLWGDPDWDIDYRGDWSVSLVNTGPQGVAISMMSAIIRDLENKPKESWTMDDYVLESIISAFQGTKNTAFSMSMLAGMTTMLDSFSKNGSGTYYWNQLAKTVTSPVAPRLTEQIFIVPNRDIRLNNRQMEFMDRFVADLRNSSMLNLLIGDDPGSLAHLDIWGNDATLPHGKSGASKLLASTVDALRSSEIVADDMTLEVFDIMEETNDTGLVSWPSSQVGIYIPDGDGEKATVDMSREMYDQMVRVIQGIKQGQFRMTMESQVFRDKDVKEKARELKKINSGVNREKLRWQGQIQDYVDAGVWKLVKTQNNPPKYKLEIPEL